MGKNDPTCPRCAGWMELDEFREIRCIQCGYRIYHAWLRVTALARTGLGTGFRKKPKPTITEKIAKLVPGIANARKHRHGPRNKLKTPWRHKFKER